MAKFYVKVIQKALLTFGSSNAEMGQDKAFKSWILNKLNRTLISLDRF